MAQIIAGPGLGLPYPQNLYPTFSQSSLANVPVTTATNEVTLAPGQTLPLAAGTWNVALGPYTFLQILDPVTGSWKFFPTNRATTTSTVRSDGFNVRIANLTNCPIAATVVNAGASWVQSSTSISVTGGGGSQWQAVVGGILSGTVSVTAPGAGYGIPPLCFLPAPGNPGVQATAVASISSGTVTGIVMRDQGAGYIGSIATITILPNPLDPNFLSGSITSQATATCAILGGTAAGGTLAAVICTNPGNALAGGITLTAVGAGANVTVTALVLQCVSAAAITGSGGALTGNNLTTSFGGTNTATTIFANPALELTGFIPRPFLATVAANSTIQSVTIVDRGLFLSAPTALVLSGAAAAISTLPSLALTMGGTADTSFLQQI